MVRGRALTSSGGGPGGGRRYVDAVRTFNTILMYIGRTKQFHARSPGYEQILKKNEQLYALLAICLSICSHPVKFLDEGVSQVPSTAPGHPACPHAPPARRAAAAWEGDMPPIPPRRWG